MSLKVEYKEQGALVVFTADGVVNGEEFLRVTSEITSPEHLEQGRYYFLDFSEVVEFNISTDVVKQIVEKDRRAAAQNPNLHVIIVSPKDLVFGLSRMWQMLLDDSTIDSRIFRDRETALGCLRDWMARDRA